MKKYLVYIWGDVEPEILGPFDTYKERDMKAGELRSKSDEDGIYKLFINSRGVPSIYPYSGGEMEELIQKYDESIGNY